MNKLQTTILIIAFVIAGLFVITGCTDNKPDREYSLGDLVVAKIDKRVGMVTDIWGYSARQNAWLYRVRFPVDNAKFIEGELYIYHIMGAYELEPKAENENGM